MPITRRVLIGTAALASAATLAPRAARAYPERPIRLIVPFAAGGAVDAVARLLGAPLTASLGHPVLIDNRGGAGGIRHGCGRPRAGRWDQIGCRAMDESHPRSRH